MYMVTGIKLYTQQPAYKDKFKIAAKQDLE